MAEKSEQGASTSDSFEALLREAAHASHVSLRSTLLSGTKLASGRFEITRRIGEGGMGVVYEAFDAERRSKVALKTLSRLEAAGIYRLKNEFRALADVSHPNLVKLHELFADEALWFFTMDLVDGVRFDAWVRPDGTLHEARLRAAMPELLQAVLAIHDAGKLHRDLKPSNVLVTPEGRVVVLDFGLAVDPELGGVGQTIADDSLSGTPAYMAPEQAAGQPATSASDLYALGVILFEALTGKLPFEGRAGEMLAAKQRDAAPDARALRDDAPADLAELCAELLRREPSARPNGHALHARLSPARAVADRDHARPSHAPVLELLGRGAELAALHDAYSASVSGDKPVIVLLSGESGIGKSALLERFLAELRGEGRAVVLSGRCYERESVPFKGFDVLVDELSRYLRKVSAVELASMIPREVSALRRLFPVLGRIEAIELAPERTVADPFELRRRAFLALGEIFGRVRDRQPLVLAIDDLQWGDLDSTTLLLHLLRQADAPRVLIVASHRSEGMRENPVLTPLYETLEVDIRLDVRKLQVGPLPAEAAASLIGNVGEAAHALLHEAGGNPFLLGELARAGSAAQGRSLAEILRARVAALPRAERALLEVLAVAARPLSLAAAATAAGIEEQARAAFDRLRAAQLARSGVQLGSIECYHDRVREAVAAGLGTDVTRAYHAALAQALLRMSDPDPEHLSEHFEHAGDAELAAQYAARAADRAMQGFAFDQAARHYDRALAHGAFEPSETHRMQVTLGDALANVGHGLAAAEAYLRAIQTAPESNVALLRSKAALQYLTIGRLARGREVLEEELASLGMSLPRTPARAIATLVLERTRLRLRGFGLGARDPEPEQREQLAALGLMVAGLIPLDPLAVAALNLRVLRRALDAGDAATADMALLSDIWVRTNGVGDARQVPELARQAQTLRQRHSNPVLEAWHDWTIGYYEYAAQVDGDLDNALRRFDRFLAFAHANPQLVNANVAESGLFQRLNVLTVLGRFAEAARELPAWLDGAWQRSNLLVIPLSPAVDCWLAVGAEAEAERELVRAAHAWSALENPYAVQDLVLHVHRTMLLHHRGDARAAWAACVAHHPQFAASFLSKTKYGVAMHLLRCCTAAARATESASASERQVLVQEAERAARQCRWGPRSDVAMARAAAACARRDRDQAVAFLRQAASGPHDGWYGPARIHGIRRRLGVLLGGDEGKALVTEADAFFRAGGVIDPERFVAATLPGFEIR